MTVEQYRLKSYHLFRQPAQLYFTDILAMAYLRWHFNATIKYRSVAHSPPLRRALAGGYSSFRRRFSPKA